MVAMYPSCRGAMNTKPVQSINLLPKDPFLDTPVGRLLSWSSAVGKHLIIFTEFIVILSIASRFKLDRDLTDLNATLVQKSAIVSSYGTMEQDVRAIQQKTTFLSQTEKQGSIVRALDVMSSKIPRNVYLKTIQQKGAQLQIAGIANSADDIALLVTTLQKSPQIEKLSVSQVRNDDEKEMGYQFILSFEVKS